MYVYPQIFVEKEEVDTGVDIPLSYHTSRSPYFAGLVPAPPESTLLKSIRTYLSDRLEVRVLMSSPSRSTWYEKQSSPFKDVGGYEVRLKNWEDTLRRVGNSTRSEWESRTVYMVCILL